MYSSAEALPSMAAVESGHVMVLSCLVLQGTVSVEPGKVLVW